MSAISIPDFTDAVEKSFVDAVTEKLQDYYFPENGHYFKNHVSDFGDETKVYLNVGETLRILATPVTDDGVAIKDCDKQELAESISMTSVRMLTAIPSIIESLSKSLPEKLDALNWNGLALEFMLYNPDKFMGFNNKDPSNRVPIFGTPACMIVLRIEPIPGKVPVCAPAKAYTKKASTKEPVKEPVPVATVKQTYAKTATAAPATAAPAAAGGGSAFKAPAGKKPFTGKKQ